MPWWPDGQLNQMVAHWAFDQDSADSRFIFNGVFVGSPVWYAKRENPGSVKIGSGAVGFFGPGYIEVDASRFPPFWHSFTIDVWLRTNFTQLSQTIVTNGGVSWELGIEQGTGKAFFSCPGLDGTSYLAGSTFLCNDAWHHLAAVYDRESQQMLLYVDGSLDAQASAFGQVNPSSTFIWIGDNPQSQDGQLHGVLDDLRIYNDARTAQQLFQQQIWHVDAQDGVDAPGPEYGRGRQQAFRTIQYAIDKAANGDTVLVWPGIYRESLFFMGKKITVRSAADAAWLQPDPDDTDRIAVTFMFGEQADSVLEHFVILGSQTALWVHQSSPTLRHLTIVNNDIGLESIFNSEPQLEHCIFWNNTEDLTFDTYAPEINFSCLQSDYPGQGNISGDPLFVNGSDPNAYDFHLRSQTGRYLPGGASLPPGPLPANWTSDSQTSPCIDAGRPEVDPYCETMSNGGRINLGAYGNTPFASLSPWILPADTDRSGCVRTEDILIIAEHWLENVSP